MSKETNARDRYAKALRAQLFQLVNQDPNSEYYGQLDFSPFDTLEEEQKGFANINFQNMFSTNLNKTNSDIAGFRSKFDNKVGKSGFASSGIFDKFKDRTESLLNRNYNDQVDKIFNQRKTALFDIGKEFSEKRRNFESSFNQRLAELSGVVSKFSTGDISRLGGQGGFHPSSGVFNQYIMPDIPNPYDIQSSGD